jgi:hypothetical protein
VRSTSHFWAKLYELSTPSQLLYPGLHGVGTAAKDAGAAGSVPEGVAAGKP